MSDPTSPDQPYGQTPPPPPPPPGYPTAPPPYGAPPPGYPYGGPPGYPPGFSGPVVPYAHWGLRVAAYVLDMLLFVPAYVVVAIVAPLTEDPSVSTGTETAAVGVLLACYALVAGFAIWNLILRQGRTGSSLGKQWVRIRVLREDNAQPLGGWLTFGRQLLHFLDSLACYLGYLWPLWDPKRQTFADKIVKSVVVRADNAPPPPSWPQPPQGY